LKQRAAFRSGEVDFKRCLHCGLLARDPLPTIAELNAIYAKAFSSDRISGGSTDQESGSFAAASYADQLAALAGSGEVLDYGAASGELVEVLRERGVECDGLELSEEARAFCYAKRGFALFGSIRDLPRDKYDTLAMIEVIEHLVDPLATLREVRAVLKSNGSVLITTPNRASIRARIQSGNWREAKKKFHLYLFHERSLRQLVSAAGFSEIRVLRFPPLQRPGIVFWFFARFQQAVGFPGTLAITAKNLAK